MSDRQHNYTEIGIVRSSDDIVTLLRGDFCDFGQWENSCTPEGKCPCCLAADEIERLRAEVERLSSPLYPAGMNAIDKVEFLHEQIVKIVKGYND